MNHKKITKTLAIIVVIAGISVLIGWIFDVRVLEGILPQFVTMKFITAVSFVFSGMILYFTTKVVDGDEGIAEIVLPISALILFLFMATILSSFFLNIHTGIEDLFVKEQVGTVNTIIPGSPAIGSMVNFIVIASAALFAMFRSPNLKKYLYGIGWIIGLIGLVAVVGYSINVPLLYYPIPVGNPMALNTAILFTLLGIGFILLGKKTLLKELRDTS